MKTIALRVNGEQFEVAVAPRTHLADFLRDQLRLTGTHVACEHGVCGACTLLVDGKPVRSCITFAVQCDGLEVRTVEGFEDDALMQQLRDAFTQEHALQCGFCTPGMLVTARDIAIRFPDADERRIRVELSGNLCRCTGYMGIVSAISSVLAQRKLHGQAVPLAQRLGEKPIIAAPPSPPSQGPSSASDVAETSERKGWTHIDDSFSVAYPPHQVWAVFEDMPAVTACLPGAELTEHDARSVKGQIRIKFGPMSAAFAGAAGLELDAQNLRGMIRGSGSDGLTGSRAKGDIGYRLSPIESGTGTRVDISLDFVLQGPLAQFSRSGLVRDFAGRLIAQFAGTLTVTLDHATGKTSGPETAPSRINIASMFGGWLWRKIKSLFGS